MLGKIMISAFWNLKHTVMIKMFWILAAFWLNISLFLYLKNRSHKVFFGWIETMKWSECSYCFSFNTFFKLVSEIIIHFMWLSYFSAMLWKRLTMVFKVEGCFGASRICYDRDPIVFQGRASSLCSFLLAESCWR